MRSHSLRLVIWLATVALAGIVIIQILWLDKAFRFKEKQTDSSIFIALKNVAEKLLMYNDNPSTLVNPVKQVASNYYTVMINDVIDAKFLEMSLKNELEQRGLFLDFEYVIYDCSGNQLVYGNYIEAEKNAFKSKINNSTLASLPNFNHDNYYFGVFFPKRSEYLLGQLDVWIFTSVILLGIIVFFAYAVWVLLQQKRLSEVQRDFINNMTHEFKTPISTIAISCEVLLKPEIIKTPERLLNYATIIQNENNRLKKQVENVLQLATFEKKDLHLNKEAININDLIRKVIKNIDANLKNTNTQIVLHLSEKPVVVNADSMHITNLMYNLLDNAIKYSKENPMITIYTENKKNGILISVEDNGIGIPKNAQKQIFQKFYRVPKGDIYDIKGYGLGLSYVKIMIEAHKGNIRVESEEGKGSKFIVELPVS